ncbi:lytic transglycosylase domain-containing protein [Hoyosella altamirensis]|uniref:Soluble lytic murein transglycosylase-like protein n=1 Tax=Hoyosella altamirensis TaxID=616997 RepID=A0A839RKC3_9ACTN|nr:lytic transglycosylase domain-containing protein [Hoyosella altamirensis]MBB3036624.1 soluble lytic murein transglycosylase-like protein [Hoyosella altamirensis]
MRHTFTSALKAGAACAGLVGLTFAAAPATASAASIPNEFVTWIERASSECAAVTPELLAAQIAAESSFIASAVSPVGAQGPSQFMPETWEEWGVDADGDGHANPFSIADATVSQARLMCHNLTDTAVGVQSGSMSGDPVDLALAAYNAGLGAVQQFAGMPSGGEYTTQTQPYVEKIRYLEDVFRIIFHN